MATPNFELVTELQTCVRRDFPLSDPTIINPLNANPLVDGEWLELDSISAYSLKRGGAGEGLNAMVFPVHTERGRYDTQAIGKVNVIMLGMYEAETLVTVASGTLSGYTIGDALTVSDVTYQGIANRRGLVKDAGTEHRVIVGYVSKVTGSKLRFVHFANQKISAI